MRRAIGWAAAVGVILVGVYLIFIGPNQGENDSSSQPASPNRRSAEEAQPENNTQLILGRANASKTIIEYGDYKCPNCNSFHTGSYVELKRDYLDTGKARIVFRNLPYIAGDSRTAAEGTYCANEQGLFEEYHNAVYDYVSNLYAREGLGKESEDVLTGDFLASLIEKAGGHSRRFSSCLGQNKYKTEVENDLKASEQDQVSGTPTFLISGQRVIGAQPITTFRSLLEAN